MNSDQPEKECPCCGLMNAEAADTCRHCGTAFFFELESLEPKFDDPDDELIVVGSYANAIEASFIKNLLEENGIEACVPDDLSLGLPWHAAATVQVRARDVEAARRIIAEHRP